MRLHALAVALVSLSASMPALADDTSMRETVRSADPAIARQLDSLKYKYEIDADGDYKLGFDMDNGRSQLAFVISAVESFGDMKVREVWAPAYRASEGSEFPVAVSTARDIEAMLARQLRPGCSGTVISASLPTPIALT